ncbi:hypothetical protein SeMB42_g02074 [Synchytrium endobioticum]|uniref:Extracellular membrane protein CFEM domain-containing protein n=1 Tax=Synchytrium endobioticum TaxID=286115 RepID=A0A507DH00_9FUNG|nr:hypothetical protein SeLEV6574_g05558 [Synchytrium endobioticum]TPX50952.1 hypothetical protein SeMB42_g02074 [Synchytrium endobioticum]
MRPHCFLYMMAFLLQQTRMQELPKICARTADFSACQTSASHAQAQCNSLVVSTPTPEYWRCLCNSAQQGVQCYDICHDDPQLQLQLQTVKVHADSACKTADDQAALNPSPSPSVLPSSTPSPSASAAMPSAMPSAVTTPTASPSEIATADKATGVARPTQPNDGFANSAATSVPSQAAIPRPVVLPSGASHVRESWLGAMLAMILPPQCAVPQILTLFVVKVSVIVVHATMTSPANTDVSDSALALVIFHHNSDYSVTYKISIYIEDFAIRNRYNASFKSLI